MTLFVQTSFRPDGSNKKDTYEVVPYITQIRLKSKTIHEASVVGECYEKGKVAHFIESTARAQQIKEQEDANLSSITVEEFKLGKK